MLSRAEEPPLKSIDLPKMASEVVENQDFQNEVRKSFGSLSKEAQQKVSAAIAAMKSGRGFSITDTPIDSILAKLLGKRLIETLPDSPAKKSVEQSVALGDLPGLLAMTGQPQAAKPAEAGSLVDMSDLDYVSLRAEKGLGELILVNCKPMNLAIAQEIASRHGLAILQLARYDQIEALFQCLDEAERNKKIPKNSYLSNIILDNRTGILSNADGTLITKTKNDIKKFEASRGTSNKSTTEGPHRCWVDARRINPEIRFWTRPLTNEQDGLARDDGGAIFTRAKSK